MRGNRLVPRSLGGQLAILCAILRQTALVLGTAALTGELAELAPDVLIVDQLSAGIPLFRLLYPRARILFYGHYPDQLLVKAEQQGRLRYYLKRAYRLPFDLLEEWSTSVADTIVVNSKYTRSVFRAQFPRLRTRDLRVVYPCVDTEAADAPSSPEDTGSIWPDDRKLLLSINRFEHKKNLDLAIHAYAGLSGDERSRARLVIAGGYDPRVAENADCLRHLEQLTASLHLTCAVHRDLASPTALPRLAASTTADILFLLSIPNPLKTRLLATAALLVYTPTNEHFGIVPLEAMLARVPVLATNTGGPLETIYDGRTGWLRNPANVEQWTAVLRKPLIPSSESTLKAMGEAGRNRVRAEFGHEKMARTLEAEVERLVGGKVERPRVFAAWVWPVVVALLAVGIAAGLFVVQLVL